MIDNVYNETPLTDGFDKFIEDSNKTETERCTYDNIDYIVPAGFSPATYSFRSAELILDGNNLMDKETNFKACLPDTRFAISFFLFVTQVENEGCCDDEAVQAWLYKKGKRKALAIRKEIPNEDGIYFDFSELGDSLSPGEYFLLLNNLEASESDCNFEAMGTNLRFSFSILPDGRHLAHPDIRNIRLHRDRTPLAGTSGRISLSFSLSRAMRKYDEFTACCYDESFFLMDRIFISQSPEMPQSRKVCTSLNSPFIWMPGQYTCLLSHNGEPFHKISFSLENESISIKMSESIKKHSSEYILLRYMESDRRNSFYWSELRRTPGFGSIKRKAMEYFQDNALNLMRKDCDLGPIRRNMNFLFIGKETEGTKNAIKDFAFILCETRNFNYVDAEELTEQKNLADPYAAVNGLFEGLTEGVVCISNLYALLNANENRFFQKLEKKLKTERKLTLFFLGTDAEINQVFETNPTLKGLFPEKNSVGLCSYTVSDIAHALQNTLKKQQFSFSEEAELRLTKLLAGMDAKGKLKNWGAEQVEQFFTGSILPCFRQRILDMECQEETSMKQELSRIKAEDIHDGFTDGKDTSFEQEMSGLNAMTGLHEVKQLLNETFNQLQFDDLRSRMGLAVRKKGIHHMIFTGNPGTGKTTVARMIGKIFHAMGLLSKGDVIVTERSRMVGQFLGETERNMQEILRKAQGNVLFIDEAYTLTADKDNRKDFGYRAVECLLTVLSRNSPDMIVVLAGYEKEMNQMLATNPGLRGRFPHTLRFEDYSADELMEIALQLFRKEEYILTGEAGRQLYETISEAVADKTESFSNARWIEQYVYSGILPAMAERVLNRGGAIDKESCRTVEKEDVETAFLKFKPRQIETAVIPRIGFRA